jgi:hypothetical protein
MFAIEHAAASAAPMTATNKKLFLYMAHLMAKEKTPSVQLSAFSFQFRASSCLYVSIYKSSTTPDHGLRRSF